MIPKKVSLISLFAVLMLALFTLSLQEAAAYADSSWRAQYYNNKNLSGTPVVERNEPEINWDWGYHGPVVGVNEDNFSARWTRSVNFTAGTYRFSATVDDGVRLWVDDGLIIDSWKDGAKRTLTADRYLSAGDHHIKLEYYENTLLAFTRLTWSRIADAPPPVTINNWRGEYFNNTNLSGNPVLVRDDANIDFNWGFGAPAPGVGADNFSVRWTRNLVLQPGRYLFSARVDDGVRVWVNNRLIIDRWMQQATQTHSGEIELPGGSVPVRMEYFEQTRVAEAHLAWTRLTSPPTGGPSQGTATVTNAYFLNVRSGPGANFSPVAQVARGDVLYLMGYRNAQSNWILVALPSGTQGWVHAGYVASSVPVSSMTVWQGGSPPTGTPGQPGSYNATVSTYFLNMRTGPGINYSIVTTLARGDGMTLTHRDAAGNWVRATLSNGTQGWVHAGYIQSVAPINSLPVAN